MSSLKTKVRLTSTLSALAMVGSFAFAPAAFAQSVPADELDDGSIVVTARKREEDILDVPVTVTAMSGEVLDQRGVVSMQSLASSTPGININDSSSGHADRGFQQIVLRGFTPVTTLATTSSLFIDGVAVSSPSAFTAISGPERIEIMKGPQSAYFGRNTFAGAINVVNKEPGEDWGGSILGVVGTRENWRVRAELEGPIVPDKIGIRGSIEKFSKNGSWRNAADGRTLGDQSTTSGSVLVVVKPTERLTIKGFYLNSKDRDGAPANARLVAYDVKNAAGAVILKNQSNCSFTGDSRGIQGAGGVPVTNNYICGTVPKLINPISANASDDAITDRFLDFGFNRLIAPEDGVQGYGLLRQYRHYHVTVDAELTDSLTATVLAGWNKEFWNTMIDLDGFDGSLIRAGSVPNVPVDSPRGFYDFATLVERKTDDSSLEGRFAFDSGPVRAIAGVSYLKASVQSGLRASTRPLATSAAAGSVPGAPGGVSENKTLGAFFGLTYDATDALSLSVEGRYQIDKITAYASPLGQVVNSSAFIPAGTYAPNSVVAQEKFKNFTPRIIVNYDITPDMMIYASWAKGVNPSQFNTNILTTRDAVQTEAVRAGVKLAVEPEKITNYELGLKGKAFDGSVRYAVAAYYAQWRNQINSITLLVPNPLNPSVPDLVGGVQNSGSADLKGIEFEMAWRANDLITFDIAGALNDSKIKEFKSVPLSQLTGRYDFSGNEMPYSSKYSFNVGAQIGSEIAAWDDASWFYRADWSYKSGVWSGQANTTKSRARNVINMRVGISKGNLSLEGFVNNVFNDTNYTSLIDQSLFDPVGQPFGVRSNAALFVNLPDKRTAGVQAKFKF